MEIQNQNQNQYQSCNPYPSNNQSIVSIGDWIVTFILMVIPIVNFVMLFVWAFGGNVSESKANWAKARLIFMLIGFVIVILFWSSIAALIFAISGR